MDKIWILSEHYYPDETATGHILGYIAEGLVDQYSVGVICAQPTYHQRGSRAPDREIHNGVEIFRCASTNLDRNVIWKRLINLVTISLSIFFASLFRIKSGHTVLVVTNPPLLPFLTRFAAWIKRARVVLLVHDVYPEVVVASGVAGADSAIVRLTAWANEKLYRSMDHIVVLGRDMRDLALRKLGPAAGVPVTVIPNWADIDTVAPAARGSNALLEQLGLEDKFVIQYAGNMGYVHDVETIIEAAALLADTPDVHFLFIGSGAKQPFLEAQIEAQSLRNITRIGQRPRSEQATFLNACDVAIMALLPGMLGVSVPSRSYNILAAGKPILGVLEAGAEIALVIEEEGIGWVVEPRNPQALAAAIRSISADPRKVSDMGARARSVAENSYTAGHALEKFRDLFAGLVKS